MTNVRTRYAPSPTGQLHIGGARTALFNYLFAKANGGEFVLRFEDTDQSRHVDTAESSQIDGLKWLGLSWDEGPDIGGNHGPYRQTEKLAKYNTHVANLLQDGKAYPCFCTADNSDATDTHGYSGHCRNIPADVASSRISSGETYVVRFRVPEGEEVVVKDLVRGNVRVKTAEISDFIIKRSNGVPTYNFAVVVDDHDMKISHVLRGEEHLSNTPNQILLYNAFGWTEPQFGHISLILNEKGKKMSKRDEDTMQFIEQYANSGYLPDAVINYLSLLGWSPKSTNEMFTLSDLEDKFDLGGAQKAPAVFDPAKFQAVNATHIKNMSLPDLVHVLSEKTQYAGDRGVFEAIVDSHRHMLKVLSDIDPVLKIFASQEVLYTDETLTLLHNNSGIVEKITEHLLVTEFASSSYIKDSIEDLRKTLDLKPKEFYQILRSGLTGTVHGPDISNIMYLLGKENTISRLEKTIM